MVATVRQRFGHQPALDGLRAVAVVAVLLYHGGVARAGGGFLGVDVFFALSGYLITSLLLVEWAGSGRVDLRSFWVRRARRLLPALLLVLLAVAAYAAVLARPEELQRIREDGLATLAYVANWRMVVGGESYFEQFATPSPLRHAWSLGIEEQWYLLWPLLVAAALRLDRGRQRLLLGLILVGTLVSVVAMAVLAGGAGDPSRAYYGADTRAHGLLIGSALAVLLHRRPLAWRSRGRTVAAQAAGVAGLLGVGAMVVAVQDTDLWMYRGGFALVAIATSAVIVAAVAPTGPVRSVLSWRPFQAIGRVSYGLYLWHWPVYVTMTPSRVGTAGWTLLGLRLLVTVALTTASYHLLEQPVRAGGLRLPRPALAAPAMAAVVAVALVMATTGAPAPATAQLAAPPPVPPPVRPAPLPEAREPQAITPEPGDDQAPLRVLVVGDSVALTLAVPATGDLLGDQAEVATAAILGCGVERVVRYAGPRAHEPAENCLTWPQRWREAIDTFQPDVAVMLIGAWEVFDIRLDGRREPFASPAHEALLREELELAFDVLGEGTDAVVALTTPCFDHRDDELFRAGSERNEPARVAWVNELVADAAAARPDAHLADLRGLVCPDGQFHRHLDGVQVRAEDGVHLHEGAAPMLWSWLLPRLEAAVDDAG